jgi:signal transduction histidine kinase
LARTLKQEERARLEEHLKPIIHKKGQGPLSQTWTNSQPKWIQDLGDETNDIELRALSEFGARTMVACPLVGSESVLGVVCLLSQEQRDANEITLNLLVSIGRQIGQFQDKKRAQNMAKEVILMRQRDDFMALLTHDLKTPLLGADRILELLTNDVVGNLNDEQRNILKQLRNSNSELVSMVQNLIQVYRYERELANVRFVDIDLSELVKAVVEKSLSSAQSKEIELVCNVPEPNLIAAVDADSISRLVQNLIDNAIKFTPRKGVVTVGLEELNHGICQLSVTDTGVGLTEEECASLFTRFWQGLMGKKYSPSVGLGLYLSKQIVDAHDGTIDCQSKINEGSAFTVKLPKQQLRAF